MRVTHFVAVMVFSSLSACGQAAGIKADSSEDPDCYAVSLVFRDLAKNAGRPADEQRAARITNEWYAARMKSILARAVAPTPVLERAKSVLELAKHNSKTTQDTYMACVQRVAESQGYQEFARSVE